MKIPKFQDGGLLKPTREDSLALYKNSLLQEAFYKDMQGKNLPFGKGGLAADTYNQDELIGWYEKLKNSKAHKWLTKQWQLDNYGKLLNTKLSDTGLYQFENVFGNFPIDFTSNYHYNAETKKYDIDNNTPPIIVHKEIQPHKVTTYDLPGGGGAIQTVPQYESLAIAPWDILSPEQRAERVAKFGYSGVPKDYKPQIGLRTYNKSNRLNNLIQFEQPEKSSTASPSPIFKNGGIMLNKTKGLLQPVNQNKPNLLIRAYQEGGELNFDNLKKGISYVESNNGKYMMNPTSTATGLYGQLYSEIKNLPEMQGITRDQFAADLDLQNLMFEKRYNNGFSGPSLSRNAYDLTKEYQPQLGDKWNYRLDEVAALSHFLGRQGTRNYFSALRDGKQFKPPGVNKTPEDYLKLYNNALDESSSSTKN